MAGQMNESSTSKLYDLWAKVYDMTFGRLVHRRHVRAVQLLRLQPGDRVLDLGVGTGMTLNEYPPDIDIVGIDLSGGMLDKAAEKVADEGMDNVLLVQGDALQPPFAEASFDKVLVTHVISVVSDPGLLLEWSHRLVKPGGRIVILNHFQSDMGIVRWFERVLNPIFVKIGWRSDLDLGELLDGVNIEYQYQCKVSVYDLWQIVVLTRKVDRPVAAPDNQSGESVGQLSPMTGGL